AKPQAAFLIHPGAGVMKYVLFRGFPCAILLGIVTLIGGRADTPDRTPKEFKSRLRRPVALVNADKGQWLFVANRDSGRVSTIDTSELRCIAETPVGRRLADLTITTDGRRLLAVDEEAGELVHLTRRGSSLDVAARLPVSAAPVSVRIAREGTRCFVASLWSR